MDNRELSILTLIHDEVKGVRADVKNIAEEQSTHGKKIAVLEDRSKRMAWYSGFGVIGSVIAGAIGILKGQ
jgi:hypothetical protein